MLNYFHVFEQISRGGSKAARQLVFSMYVFPTKGLQELVEQQNQYLGGALLTIAQRALEVFLVTVLPFVTYVVSNFSCCVDAMSLKKKNHAVSY